MEPLTPEVDGSVDEKLKVTPTASSSSDNNNNAPDADDALLMEPQQSDEPLDAVTVDCSPIAKQGPSLTAKTESLRTLEASKPVKSIVSRFEKKPEQSLDALPFRTVRSFFSDAEERSVHVSAEKQKYDALLAKQRMEAALRSPERSGNNGRRSRAASSSSAPEDDGDVEKGNNNKEESDVATEEAFVNEVEELTDQHVYENSSMSVPPRSDAFEKVHEELPPQTVDPEQLPDDSSRTTKNPKVERKEKIVQAAKSTPKPATPRKNPYANVKSKVKDIIDAPSSTRKDSNASDASSCLLSPASSTRSVERLSFASSTSSTDSTDPFALQLSFTRRKSRYDDVAPRYLEYAKSPVYSRNKEAQLERRKRLEEANSAKSAHRQQQLKSFFKEKEQRSKESTDDQVRRGEEMHKFRELVREKDRSEDLERRKSQGEARRAINGPGIGESTEKRAAKTTSSARSSLTSNPSDAKPADP
ncbi:hypothetical protein ATCC90586_007502 [Pythium insidiosum]|nr:hypothetical protein ATCC90586_007502 [Pythium insidiosum]